MICWRRSSARAIGEPCATEARAHSGRSIRGGLRNSTRGVQTAVMTTHTQNGAYEIIDVSHAVGAGTETYPGLQPPRVEVLIDYDASSQRVRSGAAALRRCQRQRSGRCWQAYQVRSGRVAK